MVRIRKASAGLALIGILPTPSLGEPDARHEGADRMVNIGNATAAIVFVGILLAGSHAIASDQGITGKKLLLKSTPKFVLLSKDTGISIAGSDPVNGADSSLSFDDGGGPVTFTLPKGLWSTNGSGTLFKYKNANAPGPPSAVKIAKVKSGLLKVIGKGLPFSVPSGSATINVVLSLDGGTSRYCMTFMGMGDGSKFLVKDAPAGSCPPPPPTPTATATATPCAGGGVLVGGFCWFLGANGASCDATCTGMGTTCSAGTVSYAGTGGTSAQCGAVLAALAVADVYAGDFSGYPPAVGCLDITGGFALRATMLPTTCGAVDTSNSGQRACACQ